MDQDVKDYMAYLNVDTIKNLGDVLQEFREFIFSFFLVQSIPVIYIWITRFRKEKINAIVCEHLFNLFLSFLR